MSIAKKCDICGKLYESYNVKKDNEKVNGFIFINMDDKQQYWAGKAHDCCPNCMAAIKLNIEILRNGGEIKKPGEVTNGDIYEEFKRNYPTFANYVNDWRPYSPPYTTTFIPMNIVLWMNDGQTKRYSYETKKLYPEREKEVE